MLLNKFIRFEAESTSGDYMRWDTNRINKRICETHINEKLTLLNLFIFINLFWKAQQTVI